MNSLPPFDLEIFSRRKDKRNELFLDDLLRVMLYTMFYKTAEWTKGEKIGKAMQEQHDALEDCDKRKPLFFWDHQPVGNAPYYGAYLQRTYRMMHQANQIVSELFDQEGGYIPFICEICKLFGVPPEVLAIQVGTTTESKVAELLQHLRHLSQTFDEWATLLQPEQTLQEMKQYRRLCEFLQRIVTDKTYVLGDEGYEALQSDLSSLGNSIDLATFFSTLEGPNTDRYILRWIDSVMLSREMGDALWIQDWHTKPNHLVEVSDKLQKQLEKVWTIVLTRISDLCEKNLFEDSLVFLANVLTHLIRTKYFLEDRELKENLSRALVGMIPNVESPQSPQDVYAEILARYPETLKMFPRTFTIFRSILTAPIHVWENLRDVKALQENPTATLETLYHDLLQ